MNPKSKKDLYTVECENKEQTIKVLNYIQNDNDQEWSHWKYVTRLGHFESDINDSNIYRYPVISFEEWVNLPNEIEGTHKPIIGYKLVKEEYKEAVKCIINDAPYVEYNLKGKQDWIIKPNAVFTSACERLKQSGVLDLWFEPVYELSTEEKIIEYIKLIKRIEIAKEEAKVLINIVNEK